VIIVKQNATLIQKLLNVKLVKIQTMGVKTVIHVNQHNIKANKDGKNRPVLTCKTYKSNVYAHEAIIYGQDGLIVAKVIYSPNKPLSCGAKVWIETNNVIKTI
jgi:hypothetical protein